ncbi:MAG: hypothetical protein L0Y54_09260 [Sporichthyaceae bacterium]|nr:hypothetical protein [Sporichthyaceae bacterium]
MRKRPSRAVAWPTALVAVTIILAAGMAGSAAAADAAAPAAGARPGSPIAAAQATLQPGPSDPSGPVIFLGIPGLRWSDVSAESTPTLFRLLDQGSAASLSVRTVRQLTCPADGWLTLGAGARATVSRETDGDSDGPAGCPPIEVSAAAEAQTVLVNGYAEIPAANEPYSYDPVFGLLSEEIRRAGLCAIAVRPGAALALADANGRVRPYLPDVGALGTSTPAGCPLTIIDLGALPADGSRPAALADVDRVVAQIAAGIPPDRGTLVVAGIGDSGPVPHLGAVLISGPDYQGGWLAARSTRQDGLVQLTDLTPTLLDLLGLPKPANAVGAVVDSVSGRPSDPARALADLQDTDVAAQVVRSSGGWIFGALEGGQYLLYLLIGGVALWRARARSADPARWRPAVRVLGLAALFFGAVPAAGYLVNLVPWWRIEPPTGGLLLGLGALALGVAALALAGPWRRHPIGPPAMLAAVTLAVLVVDAVAGSRLQLNSLFGLSPLVAGRFYGFGNVAFAVFAMAALFTATVAGSYLIGTGRRGLALLAVAALGLLAVAVDGWQAWGADFGGVIAMVPGFAILLFAAARLRLTPGRIAATAAAAVLAVAALATLDWIGPADERSHLGRFVQQVLDGDAGDVVVRKADAMLHSLTRGPEGVLVPIALVAVAWWIARPERFRLAWLAQLYQRVPLLQAGLTAMVTTAVLAALVNDSGVQVPAVCLGVAVPWVLAACARQGVTTDT